MLKSQARLGFQCWLRGDSGTLAHPTGLTPQSRGRVAEASPIRDLRATLRLAGRCSSRDGEPHGVRVVDREVLVRAHVAGAAFDDAFNNVNRSRLPQANRTRAVLVRAHRVEESSPPEAAAPAQPPKKPWDRRSRGLRSHTSPLLSTMTDNTAPVSRRNLLLRLMPNPRQLPGQCQGSFPNTGPSRGVARIRP